MAQQLKPQFLKEMLLQIENEIATAEKYQAFEMADLNSRPRNSAWSILECFEHMNLSMEIYIKQFKSLNWKSGNDSNVKIGWKGNFFAEGMRPKNDSISYKMKTAKKLTPGSNLSKESIAHFIASLNWMHDFINQNENKNWSDTKVETALGALVKLNIAESLNFILAHNERHLWQIDKTQRALKLAARIS